LGAIKGLGSVRRTVDIKGVSVGGGNGLVLIAGPCVIEDRDSTLHAAGILKDVCETLSIPLIFKSSYDKANRTSLKSYRGPGLQEGLKILEEVKKEAEIPVLSDIHRIEEIGAAKEVLDCLQIPAFLCRQTDFVITVANAKMPVNIKKGQFLAPWDMHNVIEKATSTGNEDLLLTERGTVFGYNNLVADMRSLIIMREMGYPVIFDATHSLQLPGGQGTSSGGQRAFVPGLARAALAVGIDGVFMEVHHDPDQALCDGPNSLALNTIKDLLEGLKEIDTAARAKMENF
jgi:2-dehydro-3-deoxyphosphooctonate aldolase (KDO 8-P synthase)